MSTKIKNKIIEKIESKQLVMKPAWVFYFGSAMSVMGLFLTTIITLLSIQLLKFRLNHPGLGAERKINYIISTLPWYVPVLAISGLVGGYLLLKRYDFSYSKNSKIIFGIVITGLVLGSILLHRIGMDDFLSRRGFFRQIYMQNEQVNPSQRPGRGPGYGKLR